jgi:hypothetical protein
LFGATTTPNTRSVIYNAAPGQRVIWNYNTGEDSLSSESCLAGLALHAPLVTGLDVSFDSEMLAAPFDAASLSDMMDVVQIIDSTVK